jgi:WD40 repeat protein
MLSDKLRASTARKKSEYIAIAHSASPFVTVYPWSSSGFGTKFANPATLPAGNATGVDFHPDGTAIAVAHYNSPFITVYKWSENGFGTKFTNPTVLPSGLNVSNIVKFNPTGNAVAISQYNSPYLNVYRWTSAGFGTKFTNPAIIPPGYLNDLTFSPDNTAIAVTHNESPYVSAYAWSNDGFGNKFANPATLPAGGALRVKFNPSSTAIVVTNNSGGTGIFMTGYPWSSSGFGTRFANPTEDISVRNALCFNNRGNVVITGNNSGVIGFTPFSPSGFGNLNTQGSLSFSQISDVETSPSGKNLAIVGGPSPYVRVYPFYETYLDTPFTNPATLPTGLATAVKFLEV